MDDAVARDFPETPLLAIAVMNVVPERRDDFLRAMETAMKQSAREEGVISFQFLADRDDPNRFTAVDVFRDRAAYDAHVVTPHTAQLIADLDGCMAGPPVSTFHYLLGTKESCLDADLAPQDSSL